MASTPSRDLSNVLPNEMILHIFSYVQPDDLESFSSVSRRHYNLSYDIMAQHRILKRKYTTVDDRDPYTIPELLENPSWGLYVKKIVLHYNRKLFIHPSWDGSDELKARYQACYTPERLTSIIAKMDELPFFSQSDKDRWLARTRWGGDGMLKLLLLTITPNIKTIIVHNQPGTTSDFMDCFGAALRASINLGQQKSALYEMIPLLCEIRLGVVTEGRGVPECVDRDRLAPLLALPGLQRLHLGYARLSNNILPYDWKFIPYSTTLTHLNLGRTRIFNIDHLEPILGKIKGLKFFSMDFAPAQIDRILRHNRKTLEFLCLGYDTTYFNSSFRSFREFKVLRTLELNHRLLRRGRWTEEEWLDMKDSRPVMNLRKVLPSSLKRLNIGGNEWNADAISKLPKLLTALVESKTTDHPNLQQIWIVCSGNPYNFLKTMDEDQEKGRAALKRLFWLGKIYNVKLKRQHKMRTGI